MKKLLFIILFIPIISNAQWSIQNYQFNVTDSGNVGIGIKEPTSKVHLFGNGTTSDLFNVTNDKDATKDSSVVVTSNGSFCSGTNTPAPLTKNTFVIKDDTDAGLINTLWIDSTTTDSNRIHINEMKSLNTLNPVKGIFGIGGATYGNIYNAEFANSFFISSYSGSLHLANEMYPKMTIATNGVGIGTPIPSAALHVKDRWVGASELTFIAGNDIDETYDSSMVVDYYGKVGIGTKTPAAALHIKGAEQIGNVNTLIADSVNALRLSGTATVWDDLMFPFSTGHQGNANYPPFNADSLYFEFGIDSTGADAQFMYFIVQMPHSWKEGSKIYPHVHYKYETAVGACSFRMKYKWYNIGATTAVGWKWAHMNITSGSGDGNHALVSTYSGVDGSGKTISSILICKVYLYGVAGTGTCKAYQFDIHYEKDALGSNTETQKN